MLQLRINLMADRDAQRITEEFNNEDPEKADRFRQDLINTFSYILQYPGGFQFRFRNYRYVPMTTFRYHVIYSLRGEIITIHRIRHMRQQPLKRYFGG
jgi:plasmid stabilization system protein ParE